MKKLKREILEQLIAGSAEPVMVARVDRPDWPVVLCNQAFDVLTGNRSVLAEPFADVIEHLVGRELALEISETVRAGQETTIAIELRGVDYLLALKPLAPGPDGATCYVVYWRGAAGSTFTTDSEIQQALLKAKRRIRDLSRDDPVTGLLNERSFMEVLAHDWAVAEREKSSLSLVSFVLDDFAAYQQVFGRHAADSCQRRVAQAIRRCLRRASDVAAKIRIGDTDYLVVLSHASEKDGVREFASKIATAVRELGLHHPRSRAARFVTVSWSTNVMEAGKDGKSASDFLRETLGAR
jgi:diguanylate cyclase (GGDEF)-like protein